ncbi:MAG: CDP-alcohol phosphatidyltransferase family protein [Chloroflexi bacterium]|nr:CDP-alcohol phosphatidyltransferase family protein [Chloroflexota bacterium]MYD66015.1 CDP-alcohol phosphatidyltransferase family protein [Chloroflexota bacterium]
MALPSSLLPNRAPTVIIGPIVRLLARVGVTPDMLSFAALAGNIAAAALIATGSLTAGGIVMLVFSALDFLDGALARATGKASKAGAMLDSVFDRFSEAVVLFGLLLYQLDEGHREEAALVFAVLAGSLLVSYVRARAEGLGVALTSGWLRRAERVVLVGVALITGVLLRPVLWALAVLTVLTAIQRLYLAMRILRSEATEGD